MDHRKNFETFTKLGALKKSAIEFCGKQFIDNLAKQNISYKDDRFWYEVNQKLGVPDNIYEQMLIQQQEEEDRVKAEEQAKINRLMENKVLLPEKIDRENWDIKLFETFESKNNQQYFAEAVKLDDSQITIITDFLNKKKRAIREISSLIDNFEREQKNQRNIKIISQIYLMYLYASGGDEYYDSSRSYPKKEDKETFLGIRSYVPQKYWPILAQLDKEGLITQPQRMDKFPREVTYIEFTRKGMQTAREALQKIDLDGLADFLREREYHEDYFAQERFNEDED